VWIDGVRGSEEVQKEDLVNTGLTSLCLLLRSALLLGSESRLVVFLDSCFRLLSDFLSRLRGGFGRFLCLVLGLDNLLGLGCLAGFGGGLFLLLGSRFSVGRSFRVGSWNGLLCSGRLSGGFLGFINFLGLLDLGLDCFLSSSLGSLFGSRSNSRCFGLVDVRCLFGLDLSASCGLSSGLHSLVDVRSLLCLDGLLTLCSLLFRSRLDVGLFGVDVVVVGNLGLDCLLSSGLLRWGSLSFFIVSIGLLATTLLGSRLGGRGTRSVFASSFGSSGSLSK
jgi:hypothetical protein